VTPPVQYALLAVVGVLSGLAAQRLSAAVRGSITTRIIRKSLLEGFALVPGIALTSEVLSHRAPGAGPFAMFAAAGAFLLPYGATRLAVYRSIAARSARREAQLPFLHWYQLLATDPAAAQAFLTSYLIQQGRRADLLAELRAACADLEASRRADPLLPLALARLRSEIARLSVTQV